MLREYIYDEKFQIWILDNSINVLNYVDIISFNEDKVILKCPKYNLVINGNDLIISKMLSDELLIKGEIFSIEFRR